MTTVVCLVAFLFSAPSVVPAAAQPNRAQAGATGTIAGRVIDANTKQPLADASILILPSDKQARVKSGPDGRYELVGLPPGKYLFLVQRSGYYLVTPDGVAVGPTNAPSVELHEGQRVDRIDFLMKPGGTIRGVITDDAGRPLVDADVVARSTAGVGLRRYTRTSKTGEYVIDGLPSNNYFVEVSAMQQADGGSVSFVRPKDAITYYPGVTNEQDAAAINISGGDIVRNINIIVPLRPPKGVSGRLITPSGDLPAGIQVVLESSPAGTVNTLSAARLKEGRFAFAGAKPGRYMLWARGGIGGEIHAAAMLVTIGEAPTEVDLMLVPTSTVEGRVITETGQPLPSDAIRIVAMLADGDTSVQITAPDQADVLEDGTFSMEGLFGDRIFRLNGLPPEWTIKKVLNGRRAVTAPHVTVPPATTIDDIQIVIGRR